MLLMALAVLLLCATGAYAVSNGSSVTINVEVTSTLTVDSNGSGFSAAPVITIEDAAAGVISYVVLDG
jgi:hypothetical protein